MRHPPTIALAILLAVSCETGTIAPENVDFAAAKGGGKGGPGGDPSVDAVDPNSAEQGATLDVRVLGSGYTEGDAVTFLLDGRSTPHISTNSTRFVSSTELVASISIAPDADTLLYDVEVASLGGRKGIGLELFAVKLTGPPWYREDPPATFLYPADDAMYRIRSDRRSEYLTSDGSAYAYPNGVCGVTAKVFSPTDGNGSGDAIMDPDGENIHRRDRAACGDSRTVTFVLDAPADGGPPPPDPERSHGTFHNINDLWDVEVGAVDVERDAGFNLPHCNVLRFKPDEYAGSDRVLVSRPDHTTWHVRTKPFPYDKAWCDSTGRFYHLPFALTVIISP